MHLIRPTILSLLFAISPFLCGEETLQMQLENAQNRFAAKAPEERKQVFAHGIKTVGESGIYGQARKVGDKAPDFTLTNHLGEPVSLQSILETGPVVLTWYRGGWCPYCNIALAAMQKKLPEIEALGATLVALTPELPDHSLETKTKQDLQFQVLSDVGNQVARDYGIVFTMTDGVAQAMRDKFKTNLLNGDESDELPLAATYVISQEGEITYAFLDADYRKRAEPSRIVDALDALKNGPSPEHTLLQFWENTWNPPYDIDLVDRLMTDDFVITSAGEDTVGKEAFKTWIRTFQSKIGDLRITNEDVFTSHDRTRVTSRWSVTGTNKGLFGTPPTTSPLPSPESPSGNGGTKNSPTTGSNEAPTNSTKTSPAKPNPTRRPSNVS